MDQGAIEGAMVQKERWMLRAKDQVAIEGAMGGASNVSGIYRRSDGRCELWMLQAIDQGAIDGAMGGASYGSGSN
jgi:hypothetical protein